MEVENSFSSDVFTGNKCFGLKDKMKDFITDFFFKFRLYSFIDKNAIMLFY